MVARDLGRVVGSPLDTINALHVGSLPVGRSRSRLPTGAPPGISPAQRIDLYPENVLNG